MTSVSLQVDRFGISVPQGHPLLGGATRILIIDDDPQSTPSASQSADAGAVEPGEATWPQDAPRLPDQARPMVHEYEIATPIPGELVAVGESLGEASENGHTNTSTVRELIARVEELLHRTRHLPSATASGWAGTIQFGSVLLEPATQTVLRSGQPVKVTHTEFRLLLALIRRRGAIASRVELLREVWGVGAAVSRRAVDTHIARLRRKVEDDPANPRHILTALAWGYRFRP